MASVTQYLEQLQALTQQNLDLLKIINESFFTNHDHLSVELGETKYIIPSFMSLENKINYLQEGFNNLVHAPENGEAYFNFDGNTRSIEVRSYTQTPNSITLPEVSSFGVETNNIFKDFLNPNPYLNFSVESLPNDLTTVVVKKIIPVNSNLVEMFASKLTKTYTAEDGTVKTKNIISNSYPYSTLFKELALYKKDIDYIEYDKILKLPIRKSIGTGVYAIQDIVADITTDNLEQIVTFKLRSDMKDAQYINNLYYRIFDGTIMRPLKEGDEMLSYDGKTKFKIIELHPERNEVVMRVLNGEYVNLAGCGNIDEKYITEASKIKFHTTTDYAEDKYIHIPLEEDKYVFIAVAPLNDRMNVRAPWGSGLLLNTSILEYEKQSGMRFKEYYTNNIKNVGDILNEMTSLIYSPVTKFDAQQFKKLTEAKPTINTKNILVAQINSHLNDNKTIREIRSLYSQKLRYKTELSEIQTKIDGYNKQLSEISFDDVNNTRASIIAQINALNKRKNELVTAITKIIDQIALAANNSEIPIEDAKYRIRGFFDYNEFLKDNNIVDLAGGHVNGIKVQYRYKNASQPQGSSLSINDKFLFSDWIDMASFKLQKEPSRSSDYKFEFPADNSNRNEPSFNQIDIPITQGEVVDIRLKVIYDFAYPMAEMSSDWSDIQNVQFPQELLKNVTVTTIIEENNSDIETNRFRNILADEGIPEHINDRITDQDITYFHKPENIASGFYTSERRIIPLKDKLSEFDTMIATLYNEINGDPSTDLLVTADIAGVTKNLNPYIMNQIPVEAYDVISKGENKYDGGYMMVCSGAEKDKKGNPNEKDIVAVVINLKLTNVSNRLIKLYPLFPGDRDVAINDVKRYKFEKFDYAIDGLYKMPALLDESTIDKYRGVWMKKNYPDVATDVKKFANRKNENAVSKVQTANQFITFRVNNLTTGDKYYDDSITEVTLNDLGAIKEVFKTNDILPPGPDFSLTDSRAASCDGAALYPLLMNKYSLNVASNSAYSYKSLSKGESVSIPLMFEYRLVRDEKLKYISKVISFDVRTSLYAEPINYNLRVTAKKDNSLLDNIILTDKTSDVVKYKSITTN